MDTVEFLAGSVLDLPTVGVVRLFIRTHLPCLVELLVDILFGLLPFCHVRLAATVISTAFLMANMRSKESRVLVSF